VPNAPPPGTSFTVESFTGSSNLFAIDIANTFWIPALKCANPCNDCHSEAFPSNCTSCFSSSTNFLLDTVVQTCVATCPTGYFANLTTNICVICSSTCLTCVDSATKCTSCNANGSTRNFYAPANECHGTCPVNATVRTYASPALTCLNCEASCATCSGPNSNECLTCLAGSYFYQNTCYTNCSTITPTFEFYPKVSNCSSCPTDTGTANC
jgi:proprotein convertase subtilisin/kexin type 5